MSMHWLVHGRRCTYLGVGRVVYRVVVPGTYYTERGLASPGCSWPVLAVPGLPAGTALRKVSHRILPLASRVSGPNVSQFMNEAAPRSHFRDTPL